MRYFLMVLFFTTTLLSAENVNPLLEEVEYEKVVAQAKAEYDAKVNFAKKKLLAVLETRLKEAMTRSNLAMANYLDKKIKGLINERIKLNWNGGQVVIQPNGQITSTWGDGTWTLEDDTYIAVFGAHGTPKHKIKIDRQKMTFVSTRDDNQTVNGNFVIESL